MGQGFLEFLLVRCRLIPYRADLHAGCQPGPDPGHDVFKDQTVFRPDAQMSGCQQIDLRIRFAFADMVSRCDLTEIFPDAQVVQQDPRQFFGIAGGDAAQDIIFTPICVHGMSAKSFVLSPDRILSARAECHYGKQAFMKVDGSDLIELENDDIIKVKKSNLELIMANLGQKSFYDIAFEKLIEGY